MDTQQLKLLAARIRGLLQRSKCTIGHNQSLDVVAALVGLRNWPEVQAFPDRVAAAVLDRQSASRLAFRLKRKFGLNFTPEDLLVDLEPSAKERAFLPQIWPTGPAPGVYITTDKNAIAALLDDFDEQTDGSVVYAEAAGGWREGTISLGEDGLWSLGLDRVPSGSLIVVGPIELEQSSWDDSAQRLQTACSVADVDGHRVAVLINTPDEERVFEDAHLLARSNQKDYPEAEAALTGIVTAEGKLVARKPFATPGRSRAFSKPIAQHPRTGFLPENVRRELEPVLRANRAGVVLVGTGVVGEHSWVEYAEHMLALTEHAGPAARIMPRTRGTPAKYWWVPDSIKDLPFLPSIQSAYDQGFRRMMLYANYTDADLLMEFPDVLFIGGCWGAHVSEVFLTGSRMHSAPFESEFVNRILALLAVTSVTDESSRHISDLYIRQGEITPGDYEERIQVLEERRVIKWQDELRTLVDELPPSRLHATIKESHLLSRALSERSNSGKRIGEIRDVEEVIAAVRKILDSSPQEIVEVE